MTDPNAQTEDIPPAKPPRPSATQRQLEADEVYARQLAEHYNRRAQSSRLDDEAQYRQRGGSDASEERDYSFFDGMLKCLALDLPSHVLLMDTMCRRPTCHPRQHPQRIR